MIEDPDDRILISPASYWEIAIKESLGRLNLHRSYEDFLALCLGPSGFQVLPIEPTHTTRLAAMPFPSGHKAPFDRLLIARAIVEDLPIVSVDVAFDAYPVRRIC